jgi:phenylalanyl-tRNA synthetase beta chain
MILSYAWLKELIDIPVSPEELIEVLTYLGLEVESTASFKPLLKNVIIGEVVECARIEGTEHLSDTKTNIGREVLSIVCGAPNVRVGLKVPVMLPGALTASGVAIKKAKLRGHESFGMIASEVELGLSTDHAGIIEGDRDWQVGADAARYLDLPDTTYDVEITPNRPDYLSHVGVARDLGAKFRLPWKWPEFVLNENSEQTASRVSVEILAPIACPRYAARMVRGVKIAPSDFRTRLRLTRCGLRPISNVVDVTNYLMLEFGHPLHAFDERFVEGGKILVRHAAQNEKFVTLDGKEYRLRDNDLLIADSNKGIALAGVMGGLNSEIREDTENVVIECAYFDPVHIRRTAKAHSISTDSSRRFERGMDPNGIRRVVDAAASMMQRLSGGSVLAGCVDVYPNEIKRKEINFRPERTQHVVGIAFAEGEIKETLERLGCDVKSSGNSWQISAPTHRPDLEREIDLIEEMIRVHGYDEIPAANTSRVPLEIDRDSLLQLRRKVVDIMVSLGFNETLSVSMYTPDERRDPPDMPLGVVLANPVTDDMQVLQGSVLPHLLRAAAANWLRGDRNLRLFEVARVFHEGCAGDPRNWEQQVLSGIITGQSYPQNWGHPPKSSDFYDLKGVLEVLCNKISLDKVEFFCYDIVSSEVLSGELRSGDAAIGRWGIWPTEQMRNRDIEAPVSWFELDLAAALSHRISDFKYVPLPRFPIAWRDVAVVVDKAVAVGSLVESVKSLAGSFMVRAEPFDVFQSEKLGSDKKSVAIRIEFSHPDRSLEAEEVDRWMSDIVRGLESEYGATLR